MKDDLWDLVVIEAVFVGVAGDLDQGLDVGQGLRRVKACVTVPCEIWRRGYIISDQFIQCLSELYIQKS